MVATGERRQCYDDVGEGTRQASRSLKREKEGRGSFILDVLGGRLELIMELRRRLDICRFFSLGHRVLYTELGG